MSLVGSLEDLGLGDILQIVSLSRKSGLLALRTEAGEGHIVFTNGLVRAAYRKGEAADLRSLLVGGGFLPEDEFEQAAEWGRGQGESLEGALTACTSFSGERIDSLC